MGQPQRDRGQAGRAVKLLQAPGPQSHTQPSLGMLSRKLISSLSQCQSQEVPCEEQVPQPLLRPDSSLLGPTGIFLILIFTHWTLSRKKDLNQPADSVPLKATV